MIIFLDNKLVKVDKKTLEALTPGVLRAQGVFETMRVRPAGIIAFDTHMARMQRGLRLFNIARPWGVKKIRDIIKELRRVNRLREARCRVSVWQEGKRTRKAIVCQRIRPVSDKEFQRGVKAIIVDTVRPKTFYSHVKSLDYFLFRDALLQARRQGYDEAILLNNKRQLVEGARTNVFFVRAGILCTPAVRCGCVNGVTRQIVMGLAREKNVPVRTGFFVRNDLLAAKEIFITNAYLGVVPLTSLDGKKIGAGLVGPVTQMLRAAYRP